MFERENSSNDCDTEPTDPPAADEVEEGDAVTLTAADESEPALEVAALELCDEAVEVDCAGCGVDGEGGVHFGQLEPPFEQVVAKAPELASASSAETMRCVCFKVGPSRWGKTAPGGA